MCFNRLHISTGTGTCVDEIGALFMDKWHFNHWQHWWHFHQVSGIILS